MEINVISHSTHLIIPNPQPAASDFISLISIIPPSLGLAFDLVALFSFNVCPSWSSMPMYFSSPSSCSLTFFSLAVFRHPGNLPRFRRSALALFSCQLRSKIRSRIVIGSSSFSTVTIWTILGSTLVSISESSFSSFIDCLLFSVSLPRSNG